MEVKIQTKIITAATAITLLLIGSSCNPEPGQSGDRHREYMAADEAKWDPGNCRVELKDDTLLMENDMIRRTYLWNGGHLISLSLENKISGKTWKLKAKKPDAGFFGPLKGREGRIEISEIKGGNRNYPYLQADVYTIVGKLQIWRSFRVYPSCPAIACSYYLRGEPDTAWSGNFLNIAENRGEHLAEAVAVVSSVSPVMERLDFQEIHWDVVSRNFLENTDYNNTLVRIQSEPSFVDTEIKENRLRGTLLVAHEVVGGEGFFILKESPPANDQLAYPGMDFINTAGEFQVVGTGILPSEVTADRWRRCYGFISGVCGTTPLENRVAVRNYLERTRLHKDGRDEMVLMNTWGDRNRGDKLSEEFCLAELEEANRLGINHYQLDAGWELSMDPGNEDFFMIDPVKFPNGFWPLIDKCNELGMELCLWTRPGSDYTYGSWEIFADSVIRMYRRYGIRTYKFDGVHIRDRKGEERVRAIMDKVMEATDDDAVFNLDITMGGRWGYHYFNEYGNLFVENRYTDWKNYYPHWTLRNLWMLSEWIPPQHLQMEFLNKWRNPGQYRENDPLAPSNIPFGYTFAVTLMSQPLAWFESTGLPEEAFEIAPMVKKYVSLMQDIHSGYIFPIGEQPSGTGWTGFQSLIGERGYLLVFREYNSREESDLKTWLPPGSTVDFTHVFGQGKDFRATVSREGKVNFRFNQPYNFALYEYFIN